MLCSVFSVGLPMMLRMQLDVGLMQVFVPLTGRMGSIVPPDIIIGIILTVFVITHSPHLVTCVCVGVCVCGCGCGCGCGCVRVGGWVVFDMAMCWVVEEV